MRLPDGSGVSREAPAPFCEGLVGKFHGPTLHEVFNTLKNQGYQFEHNFGHGRKNLSTNFAILMLLAFAIDQASDILCAVYQGARTKTKKKYALWEDMRAIFKLIAVDSWKTLLMLISGHMKLTYSLDSG